MKFVFATVLFGLSVGSAFAHPSKIDGRWSTKKGNCSEENRVVIGLNSVDRYESSCKVTKETSVNPLNMGKEYDEFELSLSCVSEDNVSKDKLWLGNIITNSQIKVSFYSDGPNTYRWLYRCKR